MAPVLTFSARLPGRATAMNIMVSVADSPQKCRLESLCDLTVLDQKESWRCTAFCNTGGSPDVLLDRCITCTPRAAILHLMRKKIIPLNSIQFHPWDRAARRPCAKVPGDIDHALLGIQSD